MRQIKTYMRNRKKDMLACGDCVCRTMKCWREANANCNCGGEWSEPTPPTPPIPVITYEFVAWWEWANLTYTWYQYEDDVVVDAYILAITLNQQEEIDAATISQAEEKVIEDMADATELYMYAQAVIDWTADAEVIFNNYKAYYNSL